MHTYIHKYVRMYMQLHISSLKTIRGEGEREADWQQEKARKKKTSTKINNRICVTGPNE